MNVFAATTQTMGSSLLAAALATPLIILGACLWPKLRDFALPLAPFAALPALAAALLAIGGGPLEFEQPALRTSLRLDTPGAMLLSAAALVWIIAGAFAIADVRGKPNSGRFAISWLLTLAGSLGVFIAADLLTFYFVYALVSIPAYGLIAYDEDAASKRAGGVYMAFTLLGEAVLLIAFVMLAAGEPSGSLRIQDVVAALPASPWLYATLAFLIVGFGMKIALTPLHGWMPLAYVAAPIPAAAVLSGAAVKAGVIGLIRFLPFGAAFPSWGEVLVCVGFFTAFYGVAIGVTQQNAKSVLAYSSISQMGVIAAVLGMGLANGDAGASTDVAFYAANHVMVKAALFLVVGVAATLGGRRLGLALIVAAVVALSLGGLPLTGGALAKLAIKAQLGNGLANIAATVSAAGTTLLMLHFLMRLVRSLEEPAEASGGPLLAWLALALGSILVPWLMAPAIGIDAAVALTADKIWDALWPMLVGAALAAGLWFWGDRLPRIPPGDIVVAEESAFHSGAALGAAFERIEAQFRQWPAAGLSLLTVALALAAAALAGH